MPRSSLPCRGAARVALVLFVGAALLDVVAPLPAVEAHHALFGIIFAVASAVATFFSAIGSVSLSAILFAWNLLRTGVWELARRVKTGLWDTGRYIAKGLRVTKSFVIDNTYTFVRWSFDKLMWVKDWLVDFFGPALRWLQIVKDHVDLFYKTFIRPILDTIDFIRLVNRTMSTFGINILRKLDEVLGKIEERIEDPFLWVRAKITWVENWIDRIVTADGLLQRITLLRSLVRDQARVVRLGWNSMAHPLSAFDKEKLAGPVEERTIQDRIRELHDYIERDAGPLAPIVSEMTAQLDLDIRSVR